MVYMRNGVMRRKNRHRITQQQKLILIQHPLLFSGQILDAKKTTALANRVGINFGAGAYDAPGIELQPGGEGATLYFAALRILQ